MQSVLERLCPQTTDELGTQHGDLRAAAWQNSSSVVLCFIVALGACWFYGVRDMPLLWDNQHYFFMAERAASGVPPHVSLFDPKHQLATLLSAFAIFLGRLAGTGDIWSTRLISVLVTAGSIALVWRVTFELTRSRLASYIAAMAMLSFPGFIEMGTMGARPKVFMVFFLLLTVLSVARQRWAYSGFYGALAFLCWQPALLVLGMASVVAAVGRGRLRRLGRMLAGAAVPTLLYHAYFFFHGALSVELEQAYYFPAKFMPSEFAGFAGAFRRMRYQWDYGFGMPNVLPGVLGVALLAFWIAVLLRPRRVWRLFSSRPGWLHCTLCAHGVVVFTLFDFQGYPDFFFVLPFVALASGACFAAVIRSIWATGATNTAVLVSAALLGWLVWLDVSGARHIPYDYTLSDQEALGKRVGKVLEAGNTVYSAGPSHLLAFNHVDNFVNMCFFGRHVDDYRLEKTGRREVFKPLRDGKLPDVILLSRVPMTGQRQWLPMQYVSWPIPGAREQGIYVWKRLSLLESVQKLWQGTRTRRGIGSPGGANRANASGSDK